MSITQPPLFENRARALLPRQRQQRESIFEFVDRLAMPKLDAGRAMLNKWFAQVPPEMQHECRRRFQSKDTDCYSITLELFLLDLLGGYGFNPRMIQQSVGSTPDIQITRPDGSLHLIEATVVMPSDDERGFDRIDSVFMQDTARLVSEERLRIKIVGATRTCQAPSAKKFAAWLDCWLAGTSAAEQDAIGDGNWLGPERYEDQDAAWSFDVSIRLWGKPGRPESLVLMETSFAYAPRDPTVRLRNRLKLKRRQHRNQPTQVTPAVAFNDFRHAIGDEDICALFRESRDQPDEVSPTRASRSTDIIVCSECYPWSAATMTAMLWTLECSDPSPLSAVWPGPKRQVVLPNNQRPQT